MCVDYEKCPHCGKYIWVYHLTPEQVREAGSFCYCDPECSNRCHHLRYEPLDEWCEAWDLVPIK